jgi:hypothetical protein
LTSQPETIPSCYRRSRHTEFQPHPGRHALVGKILTEENITKILRDGVVTEELPDAHMPALAGLDFSNTFGILRRLSPVKIVEFEIALGNDASFGAISLHFEGNGWKLSGVDLPAKAERALAETLPIK